MLALAKHNMSASIKYKVRATNNKTVHNRNNLRLDHTAAYCNNALCCPNVHCHKQQLKEHSQDNIKCVH